MVWRKVCICSLMVLRAPSDIVEEHLAGLCASWSFSGEVDHIVSGKELEVSSANERNGVMYSAHF